MLSSFVEQRTLATLDWLQVEDVRRALLAFDDTLARTSKRKDALGRYSRAARPILPLWSEPDMVWFDFDNPGYIEFDDRLRMALNPMRIVPWWLARPKDWPRYRPDELKKAFVAFMVGLVFHDVTHFMVWIAHRRLSGFQTLWLGEELNCTLWGTTMSQLAVAGDLPSLDDPTYLDQVVEAAQPPIHSVHIRDYLNDRASMYTSGASLDSMFAPVPRALALMESAKDMVPEHPGAYRTYKRFAEWARTNRGEELGEGEVFRWRGHEGVTKLPVATNSERRSARPAAKKGRAQLKTVKSAP